MAIVRAADRRWRSLRAVDPRRVRGSLTRAEERVKAYERDAGRTYVDFCALLRQTRKGLPVTGTRGAGRRGVRGFVVVVWKGDPRRLHQELCRRTQHWRNKKWESRSPVRRQELIFSAFPNVFICTCSLSTQSQPAIRLYHAAGIRIVRRR